MKYKLDFIPKDKQTAKFEVGYDPNRMIGLTEEERADGLDFLKTANDVFKAWQKNMKKMINSKKI